VIASLPMYDMPPVQAANDRLWQAIRDRLRAQGVDAPEALLRAGDLFGQWESPDLILSQTCGMPYRTRLHGKVTLVGTPDFGMPGVEAGYYRSVFIAHKDDARERVEQFEGAALAYNETISQSGWAAPLHHAGLLGLKLRPVLHTGGHRPSMEAIAAGQAEIAGLDAVTWDILQSYHPAAAAAVKVVGMTDPTPGLPYITRLGVDGAVVFEAIAQAIAGLSDADRRATRLKGIVAIPAEDYLSVPTPAAA
jgi:ABC-type phosphate/phosphonate transport system substrate-binding protein